MKIRAIITPTLFLASALLLASNAHASTTVKGAIKVSGSIGGVAGQCDDIIVYATSKAQVTPPPGQLGGGPVWTRGAKATGNWSKGTCSYSVNVVANSDFQVTLGTDVENNCVGYYTVKSTPQQAGWFKLSNGSSKEQNFKVDSVPCNEIQ